MTPTTNRRSREEMSDVLTAIDDYYLQCGKAAIEGAEEPPRPDLPEWVDWDDKSRFPDEGFQFLSSDTGEKTYHHLPAQFKTIFESNRNAAIQATKDTNSQTKGAVESAKNISDKQARRKKLEDELTQIDNNHNTLVKKQQEKSRKELLDELDKIESEEEYEKLKQEIANARDKEGNFFLDLIKEVASFLKKLVDDIANKIKEIIDEIANKFVEIGKKIGQFFKNLFNI